MAQRSVLEVLLTAKDQMSTTLRSAGGSVTRFQGQITALSTGFLAIRQVAGDVASAIDSTVGSFVRQARQLQSFSDRLGVAVEDLDAMKQFSEQLGVSFGTLSLGMQRMTRRVSEASRGMGEAQGALKELNLSASRLKTLSPDKQFLEIARAMGRVSSQSDRVRLSFKLFDSEGVELVRLMDEAGTELEEFIDQAKVAERVMTEDMVEAAEAAAKAWEGLKQEITATMNQMILFVAQELPKARRALSQPLSPSGGDADTGMGAALEELQRIREEEFQRLVGQSSMRPLFDYRGGEYTQPTLEMAAITTLEMFETAEEAAERLAEEIKALSLRIEALGEIVLKDEGIKKMPQTFKQSKIEFEGLTHTIDEGVEVTEDRVHSLREQIEAGTTALQNSIRSQSEAFFGNMRESLEWTTDAVFRTLGHSIAFAEDWGQAMKNVFRSFVADAIAELAKLAAKMAILGLIKLAGGVIGFLTSGPAGAVAGSTLPNVMSTVPVRGQGLFPGGVGGASLNVHFHSQMPASRGDLQAAARQFMAHARAAGAF